MIRGKLIGWIKRKTAVMEVEDTNAICMICRGKAGVVKNSKNTTQVAVATVTQSILLLLFSTVILTPSFVFFPEKFYKF